jgi:hypothetical protein
VHAEEWVQPEDAIARLGLQEQRHPRLSHGICEACARELKSGPLA